jgi:hypothetical protein
MPFNKVKFEKLKAERLEIQKKVNELFRKDYVLQEAVDEMVRNCPHEKKVPGEMENSHNWPLLICEDCGSYFSKDNE